MEDLVVEPFPSQKMVCWSIAVAPARLTNHSGLTERANRLERWATRGFISHFGSHLMKNELRRIAWIHRREPRISGCLTCCAAYLRDLPAILRTIGFRSGHQTVTVSSSVQTAKA